MNRPLRITDFQKRVYDALRRIPRGKVTTYKLLGDYVGCRCYRAVGQALRQNPFAPGGPCHRVIASDGTLGGFAGRRSGAQLRRKLELLKSEGVRFTRAKLADRDRIFRFTQD